MGTTTRRRDFIKLGTLAAGATAAGACTAGSSMAGAAATAQDANAPADREKIAQAGAAPVLRRELLPSPVTIESVELLKAADQYLVRVRSKEGATGLAAAHPDVLESTWPILTRRIAPFFAGKDARDLDSLIEGVYLANSNYKWQGLPFWVPTASVEFAVLDLLGQVAKKPIGELLGGVRTREIAVYRASGQRGNSPEEERRARRVAASVVGFVAVEERQREVHRPDRSPASA